MILRPRPHGLMLFFGLAPHDLPLTALCRTVGRDLLAALGSCDLPPAAVARDFLLL